jgi:radical SAM protein with 4Fe4S-binding SPASM domain
MKNSITSSKPLPEFSLWKKMKEKRSVFSFDLEITARCNNNCRHCYINLKSNDKNAIKNELGIGEINKLADEAVSLGAVWCLLTGGEPLLRKDFSEIYLKLKEKGLLVSVFTNAVLINKNHIALFKKYPPRDIEVSVYGVTKKIYERITQNPGSFAAFQRGVDLLLKNNVRVRFKAMALRSNIHELPLISRFCREKTKDYFRFDPFLHLRFDKDKKKNHLIRSERLCAKEIVTIEKNDPERFGALEKNCDKLIMPELSHARCNHLFHCGAGNGSFAVSYDGIFRLCSSLWQKDCVYDLRKGGLFEAWLDFVPRVRGMTSNRKEFLEKCRTCSLINLCMWCSAHADLETGHMDEPVDYFCRVAHARMKSLRNKNSIKKR